MAIQRQGTNVHGTGTSSPTTVSHTLVSGDQRMVVVCVGIETQEPTLTGLSCTYGGVAMTLRVNAAWGSTWTNHSLIYTIHEADLPSNGANTVSFSCSNYSGATDVSIYVSQYSGVKTTIKDTDAAGNALQALTLDLNIAAGDVAVVTHDMGNAQGTWSTDSGFTEQIDYVDASSTFTVADLIASGSDTQVTTTTTGSVNRHSGGGIVFEEASVVETETLAGAVTPAGALAKTAKVDMGAGGIGGGYSTLTGALVLDDLMSTKVRLSLASVSGPTDSMDDVWLFVKAGAESSYDDGIGYTVYQGAAALGSGTTGPVNDFANPSVFAIDMSGFTQITDWSQLDVELWYVASSLPEQHPIEVRIYDVWLVGPALSAVTEQQSVSGTLTSAGGLTRLASAHQLAAVTPAGARSVETSVARAGSVTSAGVVGSAAAKVLAGATAPSGSRRRTVSVSLPGALASAGTRALTAASSVVGALTSGGAVVREAAVSLFGGASPSGVVTPTAVGTITSHSEAGTITPSGTVESEPTKGGFGTVAPAGVLRLVPAMSEAGSVTSAGTVVKGTSTTHEGTVDVAGGYEAAVAKALTASISPSGTLDRVVGKIAVGVVSAAGTVTRLVSALITGATAPAGTSAPVKIPGGVTSQVRMTLSGINDGPTTSMANCSMTIRFGRDADDDYDVTVSLYQGATLIESEVFRVDTDPSEQTMDLSAGTQITDWSDLEVEISATFVGAPSSDAVRVYDLWVSSPAVLIAFADFAGSVFFGGAGEWPTWDTVWFGSASEGQLTRTVLKRLLGGTAPTGSNIVSLDDTIVGILTFVGTLTRRIFTARIPAGEPKVTDGDRVKVTDGDDVTPASGGSSVSLGGGSTRVKPE